jgi:hypothetical protein
MNINFIYSYLTSSIWGRISKKKMKIEYTYNNKQKNK